MHTLVLASFLVTITALGAGCSNDSLAGEGAPSQSGLTQGNAGTSASAGSPGTGSPGAGTGGQATGQAGGTSTGQGGGDHVEPAPVGGGGHVDPGPAGGGGTTGGSAGTTGTTGGSAGTTGTTGGSAGTTGTAGQQGGEAGQGQGGGDTGPHQCGGIAGLSCGVNEICVFNDPLCGAADQLGTCVQVPTQEECNAADSMGVCGCDGKTYGDLCSAAKAGVELATLAPCEQPQPEVCGGFPGFTCPAGKICVYPDKWCGFADGTGVCVEVPAAAQCEEPLAIDVCGCDGKNYASLCEAAAAGADLASLFPCAQPGKSCGGLGGGVCAESEFCDYPAAELCGAADGTGLCQPRPTDCPAVDCDTPAVCGCDGNKYCTECEAKAAGASVAPSDWCK